MTIILKTMTRKFIQHKTITKKLTYSEQAMWLEKFRIAIQELDRYIRHDVECEYSGRYIKEFLSQEIFRLLDEYCEKANAIPQRQQRIGWYTGSDEWRKKYGTLRDNDWKVKGIVKRTIEKQKEEVLKLIYSFSTEERKAFFADKKLQERYATVASFGDDLSEKENRNYILFGKFK